MRLIDSQSQASVSDLNAELEKARAKSGNTRDGSSPDATLRSLLFKLPGGDNNEMEREMQNVERIRASSTQPGGKRPEDMSPQELHAVLWQVLTFRDSGSYIPQCACTRLLTGLRTVVKKIDKTIGASGRSRYKTSVLNMICSLEKIPGLGPLIEKLTDSISVFIFTTLEVCRDRVAEIILNSANFIATSRS